MTDLELAALPMSPPQPHKKCLILYGTMPGDPRLLNEFPITITFECDQEEPQFGQFIDQVIAMLKEKVNSIRKPVVIPRGFDTWDLADPKSCSASSATLR